MEQVINVGKSSIYPYFPLDKQSGQAVSVGVTLSSSEEGYALGFPGAVFKDLDWKNLEIYQVNIGGAALAVYKADILKNDGEWIKTVGVYPGFETTLGK